MQEVESTTCPVQGKWFGVLDKLYWLYAVDFREMGTVGFECWCWLPGLRLLRAVLPSSPQLQVRGLQRLKAVHEGSTFTEPRWVANFPSIVKKQTSGSQELRLPSSGQ